MATLKKIFISKFYSLFLSLCFVLRIQSTFINIEELQKSKYGVEISAEPVLLDNENTDDNIMQITSKHGQQYQCVLPIVHFETRESQSVNVTNEEIHNLLQPLNDTCLYLLNGWWSYKVCTGKSVYQYHDEGNQVKDNISLGHFSGETDWSEVTIQEETRGDKRYHSQFYSNGTLCDLTGQPRKTEVRYFCNQQGSADFITRIDESSTCAYNITIYTNKLCNHSLFRPPVTPKKQSITCSPALLEDQYEKYREAQSKMPGNDKQPISESQDENEQNTNERSPDIFETLAKMYHKDNIKETEHGRELRRKDDERRKDWEDTFKKTRSILDKSIERIKQLQRDSLRNRNGDEESSDEESDNDDTIDEEEEIHEEEREDDMGWEADSLDDMDDSEGNEGSSVKKDTSHDPFYDSRKIKKDEKSDHYEKLIERLKIQYRFFKKQLVTMTDNMKEKIKRLESGIGYANPAMQALINTVKLSVKRLENKQRVAEDAMRRLTDLYDAVMEDPDYLNAQGELASIRATLFGLLDKSDSSQLNDDVSGDIDYDERERKRQPYKPSIKNEEILKAYKGKKIGGFDMETPKLDKVVSKLKKIMTRDNDGDMDGQRDDFEDDRISVRVTKIKEKSEDIYDDNALDKAYLDEEDEKEWDEINGNEEMKAATKKMESLVRKQLEDAGVNHEGKIKVKIITSKEALQRVAGGEEKFQILTSRETNQFRDLLSNLLGGTQELMKEKKRQEAMEDNYNLVWNQDGFTSATGNQQPSSPENEDNENR